jgi:hypothetical protein
MEVSEQHERPFMPGLDHIEFVLSRRIPPTIRYNPTPWNPRHCWIGCVDTQHINREQRRKWARNRGEIGPKLMCRSTQDFWKPRQLWASERVQKSQRRFSGLVIGGGIGNRTRTRYLNRIEMLRAYG